MGELRHKSYRGFREGDVLVAKITPSMENGKVAVAQGLVGGWGMGSTEFHILRPHQGLDPWYVAWYVLQKSFRAEARMHMTGTAGQLRVPAKYLRSARIPLSPRSEQRRIVKRIREIISCLDTVEITLKGLLDRLMTLRAVILTDAFHTERPLPEGWKSVSLGQVCQKPQYGWTTKSKKADGLYYLRTTDISSGNIDWDQVPSCIDLPKAIGKYVLRDGDIVVSRAGSVGVSHLVRNPRRAVFASYLMRLRTNEHLMPEYLAFYLKSPAYWEAISENKIGIAIPNVNAKKLASIPIPVPSHSEQQGIVERIEFQFSQLDTIKKSIELGLEQVSTLHRSVLAEAFTGRLVPQNHADEAASALLERIAASRPAKLKRRRKPRA